MRESTLYYYRFVARIIIEATTPLCVGSGLKDFKTDATVMKDENGMPYIPGTSLAGVFRHLALSKISDNQIMKDIFGFIDDDKSFGSRLAFTDAKMVGLDKKTVLDGILPLNKLDDEFYNFFKQLPIRQHTKINEKGTASKGGKFDEEIVYSGTRFCFEVELIEKDIRHYELFNTIISKAFSEEFTLGGNTHSGFGRVSVVKEESGTRLFDLTNTNDRKDYLEKSSSLNNNCRLKDKIVNDEDNQNDRDIYRLELTPVDFFLFGSGIGNDKADMTPVREKIVSWKGDKATFSDKMILIPATSVKGAIAHRVAYYYNLLNKYYVGDERAKVSNENLAIQQLFGYTKTDSKNQTKTIPGHVLISDGYYRETKTKVLNHVAIDRFTGGAIDTALFDEEVDVATDGFKIIIEMIVKHFDYEEHVKEAFTKTLNDIRTGMLPLGGGINRGNGCFTGKIVKNGVEI